MNCNHHKKLLCGLMLLSSLVSILAIGETIDCDVVIVGGTTASFAAAISSASENVRTCLLEPTDWVGGQLTATGVPAIDFAFHKLVDNKTGFVLDVGKIDKQEDNVTPSFWKVLHQLPTIGKCWVSNYCYLPKDMLVHGLWPLQDALNATLKVFTNTVIKNVQTSGNRIESITAVQREVQEGVECDGYDIFPSFDIVDWYSEQDSKRWKKSVITFSAQVYIDASDWGELLVLSQAPYLQGMDERFDGDTSGIGNDTCGQSIAYDFCEIIHDQEVKEPPNPYPVDHESFYSLDGYSWDQIWTYRRLYSRSYNVSATDITLQNWGTGNDYVFGYLFASINESLPQVKSGNWTGGINFHSLYDSETLSYGWHYWYKTKNSNLLNKVTMDTDVLGTCHGLSKLPYIRDTRRSIGIDNFVMKIEDISGPAEQMVGTITADSLALGAYDVDIHPIRGCNIPDYMKKYYPILPYFIPLRAFTNAKYSNLLVAGKTMAQSFLVNAATRLHPVEWSSGTACGAVASFMVNNQVQNTKDLMNYLDDIKGVVQRYTPISWTIDGKKYPPN